MYKKALLAIVLGTAVLTACSSSAPQPPEEAKKEQVAKAAPFIGLYSGVTPCASCEGIELNLSINADTTYDLKTTYIGSADKSSISDMAFMESGVYKTEDDIVTLITPSSGNKTYFKLLDDGNLLRVSEDGSEPLEPMRDLYILKKVQ